MASPGSTPTPVLLWYRRANASAADSGPSTVGSCGPRSVGVANPGRVYQSASASAAWSEPTASVSPPLCQPHRGADQRAIVREDPQPAGEFGRRRIRLKSGLGGRADHVVANRVALEEVVRALGEELRIAVHQYLHSRRFSGRAGSAATPFPRPYLGLPRRLAGPMRLAVQQVSVR